MMDLEQRYIGIDAHKQKLVVAAVNIQQEVVWSPKQISTYSLKSWAEHHLRAGDKVVLEATGNTWDLYDQLQALSFDIEVVVANAHKIKLISSSRTKTDKHDALILAKLLAANLIPEVWVPPVYVRELRRLVAHHHHLIKDRVATKNRLQSVLYRYNLKLPEGHPFHPSHQQWWDTLPVTSVEKLCMRHDLSFLDHLNQCIEEVETAIAQLSIQAPWNEQVAFVMQLPGVGVQSAMTILSAIGEIERFPDAKALVGYSGLGASIFASGNTQRTGRITKQGRRELRTALVEAAWIAVRYSEHWQQEYFKLTQRMDKNKAICAIARKLLVTIWHLLTKRVADRHADPNAVGRSFLEWAARHKLATQKGLSRAGFVWQELDRIGLGQSMIEFQYNDRTIRRPITQFLAQSAT